MTEPSRPAAALPPGWPALTLAQAHERLTAPGAPFEMIDVVVRGIPMRTWKNAPPTMREVFVAGRAHGEKIFLVHDDERASFEMFARASVTLAHALTAQGVAKGDRVAVIMRNVPEWPVAFFAALLVGAIVTPLNAWWTGPELQYGLADSGAKVAIVDAERFERIAEHLAECPDLKHVWVSRENDEIGHPHVSRLEDVIGETADWARLPVLPLPEVSIDPDDDATIFYTSGTTGKPKGALGTHRNSATGPLTGAFGPTRAFVRRGEPVPTPESRPQRATLIAVPFFHVTGCQAILIPSLYNGGKIVTMRRWDAVRAMQLIERERVTSTGGVPTIAWQIVEHPDRERFDLSSLESVSYGGAPAASELVRRLREVFPQSSPGMGWGMSETSSTFTAHLGEDYVNRPESAGPAVPVCEMRIVDEQGNTLPPGEVGELWAFGPNIVRGYWNKPQATAETFIDGWVRTGDIARLDDEGFLFIVDRKKDMLIRGGENIYCIEVEDALYAHPAVIDAAVVGRPHRTLGEEPVAVVTLKHGAQAAEDELREFVASRLAAFKVPVRVLFHEGMLPRNANGKIMKSELKPLFAEPAAGAGPAA